MSLDGGLLLRSEVANAKRASLARNILAAFSHPLLADQRRIGPQRGSLEMDMDMQPPNADFRCVSPPKTNMTLENPPFLMQNTSSKWWIFHCHCSFQGGKSEENVMQGSGDRDHYIGRWALLSDGQRA